MSCIVANPLGTLRTESYSLGSRWPLREEDAQGLGELQPWGNKSQVWVLGS